MKKKFSSDLVKTLSALLVCSISTFAAAYFDDHDDGNLTGWTQQGSRTWSESGGNALPQDQTNNQGFLINNLTTADDGTFTFTLYGPGNNNSLFGGGVFRFTDMTHFYYITINEAWTEGAVQNNEIRLKKNSIDASSGFTVIRNNLNLAGMNSTYTIMVQASGSTFTFWLNGVNIGQYVDAENPSGKVGYAYGNNYIRYVSFYRSSWFDATPYYTWDNATTAGIQTGSGTWGTDSYWTPDGIGTILSSWQGAGHVATFAGTDGTYTITVNGTRNVDSIAILKGGYTISGGTALDFGNKHGIYVASGKTAAIATPVGGTDGFVKDGDGTLNLTGTNAYADATTIAAGTLRIGNGTTSGSIPSTSNIINNGSLIFNRSDDVIHSGVISGSGSLTLEGTGMVTLTGNNTFTGLTTVPSGRSLDIGNSGATGQLAGDVAVDGTLYLNRSGSIEIPGSISGSGNVYKWGTGTLILTGDNTYTGTTYNVDGAGLQIGNGGTGGSIAGDIENNFPLVFNRSDVYLHPGIIFGSGGITNTGTGTTTLGGINTFTGTVSINNGAFSVSLLASGSTASNIGASTSDAANLVLNGGALLYTGAAVGCNRLFTVGTNGAALSASGTGPLTFTNTGSIVLSGAGSRTLSLSGTSTDGNTFAPELSGTVGLTKTGTGSWIVTGSHTYSGATQVDTGTLVLNGSIDAASAFTLNTGATLGGTGTIGGNCTADGTIAPGTAGVGRLNIGGDLTFTGTAELEVNGTAAGVSYDQLHVIGSVTLTGSSLSLTLGYAPSVADEFILIDNEESDAVTGTFTGLPDGAPLILSFGGNSYHFTIRYNGGSGNDVVITSVSPATDFFWDQSSSPGIQTGDGTWGSDVYWSADGTSLGAWPGAGNSAIFGGTDGAYNITVDGTQAVDSITFLNGIYTLNGGTIDLDVKNGIYVEPAKTAVIGSAVNGSAGLTKHGTGTLVLTGTNTYSGTTANGSGTLQIGNGGTTGSVPGDISNNGSLVVNRSNGLTYAGRISGSGTLTKRGNGTLTLTGNNTHTGATTVTSGTLQIGNGGTSGSLADAITDNSALVFNRSDDYTHHGPITGTGTVTKSGTGTLTLTAVNTVSGGVTISTGTLQLGNGGTAGWIGGTIVNNSAMIINRSNLTTFNANISGTGTVTKTGTGTTVMLGTNTYTGTTTVNNGTLQIGTGGIAGSIVGDITNNAAITVNRTGTFTYGGVMSGTGTIAKSGTGTLLLTGANTATGSLTISQGMVQIGDNDTTGNYAGDIINNDTLHFNRSDDYTCAGSISGTGGVIKSGAGTLTFGTTHTYTGVTSVSSGTLLLNGLLAAGGGTVSVAPGATLSGTGVCNRTVTLSDGGVISPGTGGAGKLTTGALTLGGTSVLNFDLGTSSDTIAVNGNLTLDGIINFNVGAGFTAPGTYRLITFTGGTLTDNNLTPGTGTPGIDYTIVTGASFVDVNVLSGLITGEPHDTTVINGADASFTVGVAGTDPITYEWYRYPSDGSAEISAGDSDVCTITGAPASYSGDTLRCIVHDNNSVYDTSRSAIFTVISEPQITTQPHDTAVLYGENGTFSVTVSNTDTVSFAWRRIGADTILSTTNTFTRNSATFADSADSFYCSISNLAAAINSDTVVLTVNHIPPVITTGPVSDTIRAGENALFSIAATGNALPVFSWFRVGTTTAVGTGASFSVTAATFSDSGRYYCIATNPGGTATSDTVILHVTHVPPSLANAHPDTASSFTGGSAFFTVTVSGTPQFSYTWYKVRPASDTVVGSADDSLLFPATTFSDGGDYYCIVTNPSGADTSDTVNLIVNNPPPSNCITIDTLYFDSLAASLRISWCIDSSAALTGDMQVGITYSLSQFPLTAEGADHFTLLARCTDTLVTLHEPLLFDTLYYVALWLRIKDGAWLLPTDNSRRTICTGAPFRQFISFFDSSVTRDTVDLFNGAVSIWKDSTYTDKNSTTDTLEIYYPRPLPEGCIVVGTPFVFCKGDPVLPFYVGIRIDSLPNDAFINDVRIYSNSGTGIFLVDYETIIDSAHGMVYIKTGTLRRSFIAMIDTTPPTVSVLSDTASYIYTDKKLTDSIIIKDNIANVRWSHLFSSGDRMPSLHSEGTLGSTTGKLTLIISDTMQVISSESGLRALLVITDGAHRDTVNLSRRVMRKESDVQTTEGEIWTPVYPTGILKYPTCDSLISRIAKHDSLSAGYNDCYMRLYRWIEYSGNKSTDKKWVEYAPKNDTLRKLFTLSPGTMVWLKTRDNVPLHLDTAYTLSLKNVFGVSLPPEQWTDFGMPYRFGVAIEDILTASGHGADSVLIYRWKRDSSTNIFQLEPFYTPGLPGKQDRSVVLTYQKKGGYSLYNRSAEATTLRIPPVLPSPEKTPSGKKKSDPSWSVLFSAKTGNGAILPAVYCGYAPGIKKRVYPVTPSFGKVRALLFDRKTARYSGHFIGEEAQEGLAGEILLKNSSDSVQTVSYTLEQTGAFPENFEAACYNPVNRQFENAAEGGMVSLAPGATASRWMVTGNTAYMQSFLKTVNKLQFMLHAVYPNPARALITIRYTVPLGVQERFRIAVYSMLGKRVWEKRIDGLQTEGTHTIIWNGKDPRGCPVGSGLYVVQLTVVNQTGKPIKKFEQRLTWLR